MDIIDEYFMPKILTMAKFHVEAINNINSLSIDQKEQIENSVKSQKR
jgi:hypothetical protein